MNTITSNRVLILKGGYNFRDLGGLITETGKAVKKDLLFRTDELSNLYPEDLEKLAQLNIQTVVDFRTDIERSQSIDKVPNTCTKQIHLDILVANMDTFMKEIQNGNGDFKGLLIKFYKDLVLSKNSITEFTKFFQILQNPENTSIIYHCTAGKDRTGVATALILKALKVGWDEIEADYLLSNEFLKNKYADYLAKNPALSDLFLVQPEYLQTAIETIESEYHSTENYLNDILKVDINLLQNIYTE